jgi:hypothetical protein
MSKNSKQTTNIQPIIYEIRDVRVMLDSDLAKIYGVTTSRFNEAFKRNRTRFPSDFAFQLTSEEFENLMSQIAISSSKHGGRRKLPWVFTEHGALMAANILRSSRAVEMSIYVVRAFVKLRELSATNAAIMKRLAEIDKTLLVQDRALAELYQLLLPLLEPEPIPEKRRIGFKVS